MRECVRATTPVKKGGRAPTPESPWRQFRKECSRSERLPSHPPTPFGLASCAYSACPSDESRMETKNDVCQQEDGAQSPSRAMRCNQHVAASCRTKLRAS